MQILLALLLLFIPSTTLAVGVAFEGGTSQTIGLETTFVIAGQSNNWGSAGHELTGLQGVRYAPSATEYPQGRVMKFGRTAFDLQATDTAVFWPSNTYEASHWPWFVKKWIEETHEPVRLVFWPWGGSCLTQDDTSPSGHATYGSEPMWDHDPATPTMAPAVPTPAPSYPHADSGKWIDDMITMLTSTYRNGPALKAVLWNQGGCETVGDTYPNNTPQADYQAALEDLADFIWDQLGVPMIVAPTSALTGDIGSCPAATAQRLAINAAQDAAIAAHAHIYGPVNTDDLQHYTGDCSHVYDVKTMGERWFDYIDSIGMAH